MARPAASKTASAPRPTKAKNIFRKRGKAAKQQAADSYAALPPNPDSIALNGPLLAALDDATAPNPARPNLGAQPHDSGRGGGQSDFLAPGQGRTPAQRPAPGEAPSDSSDAPVRVNKLVPTNAVHTTKRRMKRNNWQGPTLGLAGLAALMAVLILSDGKQPPEVSPLEQQAEAPARAIGASRTTQISQAPRIQDPVQAAPKRTSTQMAAATPSARNTDPDSELDSVEAGAKRGLKVLELVELERMLKRLDMEPSQPDGIVDGQTQTAIRMYQQIAGLPIDGEPSTELLDDMREVVKMMDGEN